MASATTTGSLKEKQRQERERLILEAALDLLMEKGFHEMSVDEVAQRVGISKGTVYLHFPSKDDLLFAVFVHTMRSYFTAIGEMLTGAGTPRERLRKAIAYVYTSQFRQQIHLMISISEANPDLRTRLREHKGGSSPLLDALRAQISTVLDEGKANGDFAADVPTDCMIIAFEGLLMPRPQQSAAGDQRDPATMADFIYQIFINGIAAHTPHETQGKNS